MTPNTQRLKEVQAILGSAIEINSYSVDLSEIQGAIGGITKEKIRRASEAVRIIPIYFPSTKYSLQVN